MRSYAQTNIQLFNQLQELGYPPSELEGAVSAYELAMTLMTGRFRPSGKTFLAHLVGTASILASLRAAFPLVAAGLLHAAYSAGDFGDGLPGISDARRARVRAAAGERAEEYVFRYQTLSWSDSSIRSVSSGLEGMTPMDRDVVVMRIANELEEFLDLGILYGGERKRLAISEPHRCRLLIEMARQLGFPALAAELDEAAAHCASTVPPAELLRRGAPDSSFLLAPASYQRLKDSLAARFAALDEAPGKKAG